ncbi:hypothetical protein OKA05_20150 [Luteolibacter arcticus]|uniref:Uncharacterized protein n=1 Tax=Luteolibacter arcticus TaxID=1581411 RepID=A0ABT3GMZ0_9BACT|nr:hypothetical protein [Luteolibacter arcticus]MCW1924886.1 hypothetical protein [Luteolibacter arcticus]
MKLLQVLSLALALCLGANANPATTGTCIDSLGRFQVNASIPAGTRHAVLEVTTDLSSPAPWRKMLACSTDGRAANLIFRLPAQPGGRCFARVRTGPEITPPAVELSNPDLITLSYGPAVAESVKVGLLSTAGAKMIEWDHLPGETFRANLIAWAKSQPNVEDAWAESLAGNICIRFADGDVCVLMQKPRTSADGGTPMPIAASDVPVETPTFGPTAAPIGDLPGKNRAVAAFSLESHFPNSAPTIAGRLNGKGYTATNYPSTTVPQIVSWAPDGSPLGVLFWHAHGVPYEDEKGVKQGVMIVTGDYAEAYYTRPIYSELRQSGELELGIVKGETVPQYGITAKFIRQRMHFAPHSIVVLDACFGADPDLGKAFIDANAGSFVSWDWLSGDQSGTPCLKIFDRLLGTNEEPPISMPKERSFSLDAIRWWMAQNGYDYDPSPKYSNQGRPNAKLVWYHHKQTPGHILLPSVMRMIAEAHDEAEPFSKYLIEGDFGPDPGPSDRSVLWGGQPVHVERWHHYNGIVIRTPQSPPRGEIQVVKSKDYYTYSNKVPITEWTVPFKYEVSSEGALSATMDLNVKFRGDIHGSRGMPEMTPQYLGVVFSNMADCTGTVTASGAHHPDVATTVTWSGGSSLTSIDPAEAGQGVLTHLIRNNCVLQVFNGNALYFNLTATGTFTSTERVVLPDGGVRTTVSEDGIGLDVFVFLMTKPLSFNPATGRLAAGSPSFPGAKLSWPAVTPQFAPTDETVR